MFGATIKSHVHAGARGRRAEVRSVAADYAASYPRPCSEVTTPAGVG
jgi:hypothetical protein